MSEQMASAARISMPFQRNASSFAPALQEPPTRTDSKPEAPVKEPIKKPNDLKEPENKNEKPSRWLKKGLISVAALAALCGLGVTGYHWYQYALTHEETDDAYTSGHMHAISSRINDTVEKVLVDDNQHVKAGQVLVLLDPRDYKVRVDQALAALSIAEHQAKAAQTSITMASTTASGKSTEAVGNVSNALSIISRSKASVREANSAIPQAEAELGQKQAEQDRASKDYARFQKLAGEGAVSLQQRDQAMRDFEVAKDATRAAQESVHQAVARLDQAEQSVASAQAQLVQSKGVVEQAQALHVQTAVNTSQYEVAKSSISQAQAQLEDARLQLSYTKITAPVSGRIGKKTVEEGQRVQPGQQMMAVVSDDVWVLANFKETQLERMRPHQPVEIKVDSFPHHLFSGTVDSVSPGSGASFALLPPDNATGNFTKIVQRVPVKVIFDQKSTKGFESVLVPGMSAVVKVTVGSH